MRALLASLTCAAALGCSDTGPRADDADALDDAHAQSDVTLETGADAAADGLDAATRDVEAIEGVSVRMDLTGADFYDAPWPSAHRRGPDGGVRMAAFPNPQDIGLVNAAVDLVERDARGFGTTSGIFLAFDGPLSGPDISPA